MPITHGKRNGKDPLAQLFCGTRQWLVELSVRRGMGRINRDKLRRLASELLKEVAGRTPLPCSSWQTVVLSLLCTDDSEIHQLNVRYRGKDKPTDVLSFSQLEGPASACLTGCLGDVVISLETAAKQAKRQRCSVSEEVLRLLVHGILHLFGYDHERVTITEARRMRRLQERLVRQFRGRARALVCLARPRR